jgi:outer membrane protein OmpA-like peptidoglycan-associated protein
MASLAIALMGLAIDGCSKREPAANVATPPASSAPAAAPRADVPTACAMVTAAEMSTILGTTVGAEGDEGGGTTTCAYRPADGSRPFVEVKVEWGGGSAAMVAMRMMGRLEPGMANPFAGLGDEASAIGPAFMVRTGEDLVNLTLAGVEDNVAAAKRIIDTMRPRMGTSAQAPTAVAAGTGADGGRTSGSSADDAARAGQVVGGLLAQLMKENHDASRERSTGGEDATRAATTPAPADEPALGPAKGPSIHVPLVAGLTLVAAHHEPRRGDYEPIATVSKVTNDAVSTVYSADLPEGHRLVVDRVLRQEDLKAAREYRGWYEQGDPPIFAGTTALRVSTAVYTDLKTKGRAAFTLVFVDENPLVALARQLGSGGPADVQRRPAMLERIEPYALAFPILLNDEPAELHVIHARGLFGDETIDFYVLDDRENPLVLRAAGRSTGRVVRIAFPTADAAPIEEKLKRASRVELHGIYFDFGKATIRPESEPVLRDIASALSRNPRWTLNIEGHTDNVGGDALNLDLSRRRADAVKQALVDRHRVSAASLTTAGVGASRPNASNDTLSGRARNRRVELVRQ